MRNMKKLLALGLSASMILGLGACGEEENPSNTQTKSSETAKSSEVQKETGSAEEPIEITVWAHNFGADELGILTDPVSAEITARTGIAVSVFDNNDGTAEAEKLATMMASNDLPDLFYVPNMDTLETLIASGQIINLEEYWNEENCPNMSGKNGVASARQEFLVNEKLNGERYAALIRGGTAAEDQPTVGFYVPWDIYSEIGYPEVNSFDDMVDLLEVMHDHYSETPDGLSTFGVGAYFANDGADGPWYVTQLPLALGYNINSDFGYVFDMKTNNIIENPILDEDSIFWQSMKFYFDLNQKGLLDPDSITMKGDQWNEKAYAGRYLMIAQGWLTAKMKQNTGWSYVALRPFSDCVVMDWSSELNGDMYAISSTCENPEKALQLLDFLWSPEGCRLVSSGIEDLGWEMVDGKAQYTSQYLEDEKNLTSEEMIDKYGRNYSGFVGYASNYISPLDNSKFALKNTPEYRALTMTEFELDAMEHYGVDSIRGIYTENCENAMYVCGEYTSQFETMSDELAKNSADLQNFVQRNYLSCIFAEDEAEYEKLKQSIIEGSYDYNIEGLSAWYKEQFTLAKEKIDPYLNAAK